MSHGLIVTPEPFVARNISGLWRLLKLRIVRACATSKPVLGRNLQKLCSMGLRGPVAKSTLADANELRDWRIWSDLAAVLIKRARKLYLKDDFGLDLANTVYALDSTTIDLCLSLFP